MPHERRRHQLYEELKHVMSQESADELMAYLPPVGWADVATKADLATLRNEMDALRADIRGEIALLRGHTDSSVASLRAEMHQGFATQTRWMVGTILVSLPFAIAVSSAIN